MRSSKLANLTISALTVLSGTNAFADDTEVFFGAATGDQGANVLFIIDTSGSMAEEDVPAPVEAYNPATTYSASGCSSGRIYYKAASNTDPISCSSSYINSSSNFYCNDATTISLASEAGYQDYAVRWRSQSSGMSGTTYSWNASLSGNYSVPVTCQGHSDDAGDTQFPTTGTTTSSTNYWGGNSSNNYWTSGTKTAYKFYSNNYVAYLTSVSNAYITRIAAAKSAAISVLNDLYANNSNVKVGLMRYDSDSHFENQDPYTSTEGAEGGMVIEAVQPLTSTSLSSFITTINGLNAAGPTPLSETLYEAYLYYSGGNVLYGNRSERCSSSSGALCSSGNLVTQLSTNDARTTAGGSTYKSPADSACKANYIVYLTDGEATLDQQSNSAIASLTGATCPTATSGYDNNSSTWNGVCLAALSGYMHNNDLRSSVTGKQNVTINYIALGPDVDANYLNAAATAGGGKAYDADDYSTLYSQLSGLLNPPSNNAAAFTSPSVAVNAFNKTQILEDMYVAMFKPSATAHWNGNLKKFKLRPIDPDNNGDTDLAIVGRGSTSTTADTVSAVGTSGFFTNDAKDFWQATTDATTDLTTKGGAANLIPAPGSRNVYTYIGTNTPTAPVALSSHLFNTANTGITDSLLGTTSSGCSTTVGTGSPCRATLINWTRGDSDGDGNTSEADPRHIMGDPIHSQPSVVIYGSGSTTTDQLNDAVVYVATNDGFLHAIDASSGVELWSFIPQELFGDLINIYEDENITLNTKHYSLDGDIRVLKYDQDNDGKVESGDKVFLYVSQGRGGDSYYALDVTSKNAPKFMWSLNSSTLSVVNKSWSTPTLGRVNTGATGQNAQKLVLIFGGGYDDAEDAEGYTAAGDTYGNAIYMVDAVKGTVLWSQTVGADAFANMTHAIPGNVTVLDTNSDGYSDRMYVGDMAGQLWRFDITNFVDYTAPTADIAFSVAGGVIASLGAKAEATPSVANNRVFYNSPDVAEFVVTGSANYYNIAIGSGDRAKPKSNVTTQDYFYSIRDYQLGAMSQAAYNNYLPIKHADLTTVTGQSAVTIGTNGWKLALTAKEKALAQSVTVNGVVMFTTFIPGTPPANSCDPSTGSARAYTVVVNTGMKYFTDDDVANTSDGDGLYEDFSTTGLPAQVSIVNEGAIIRTDGTTGTATSTSAGTCLSGVTILGNCVDFGRKVKTFWQESGAN